MYIVLILTAHAGDPFQRQICEYPSDSLSVSTWAHPLLRGQCAVYLLSSRVRLHPGSRGKFFGQWPKFPFAGHIFGG